MKESNNSVKSFLKICIIFFLVLAQSEAFSQAPLPAIVLPFTANATATQADGYIFTTAINNTSPISDWPSIVMMLDEQGELLFYKPITDATSAPYQRVPVADFKIHPDGRMSYNSGLFGPNGGIFIMDSTFTVIDTLNVTAPYKLDGHDFFISPDGHYHLLAKEERIMDASGMLAEVGLPGDTNCVVTGHIIQEFDENKVLVNEWKSLDHYALEDIYWYNFLDPGLMNHAHVNSVFVDYEGNYVISSRALNEITRIDRQTGDIIWRMGGKNNQFTFLGDTVKFTAQHNAQLYEDGTLVLFDNASHTEPHAIARAIAYQVDTANMTVTPDLDIYHPLDFSSGFMGSTQRLDLDHTMVSWGGGFNYNLGSSIQEFDGAGDEVLEIDYRNGWVAYRAVKHELPWEFIRPEIECDESSTTLSSTGVYQSYLWSTGETTASITISAPGTYQLWTNLGDGFVSSLPFVVNDLSDPCGIHVGLDEISENEMTVYPVPANDLLNVKILSEGTSHCKVELFDLQGRSVYSEQLEFNNGSMLLDVSDIPNGSYQLHVIGLSDGRLFNRAVSIMH